MELKKQLSKAILAIVLTSICGTSYVSGTPKTTAKANGRHHTASAVALKKDKIVMVYKKTPCYGTCPHYTATFYSSNKMIYEGFKNVPLTGKFEYTLQPVTLNRILTEAKRIGFMKMAGKYAVAVDFPSTITTLTLDGKTKTVEVQASAPERLKDFQTHIHEEIQAILTEQPGTKIN